MPLAVYFLGAAIFAQGTSELILSGLLPDIADDLSVSIPQAGMLTSAFAVGMAIGAPILAVITLRWDRRRTMLTVLAGFAAAHIFGALAPTYEVLLATRFVGAFAYAGFWAVASVTAVTLAGPAARGKAMSIVAGGLTVATVVGVPAGTFIGQHLGWRAAFWTVTALTLLSAIGVWKTVPHRAPGDTRPHTATTRQSAVGRLEPRAAAEHRPTETVVRPPEPRTDTNYQPAPHANTTVDQPESHAAEHRPTETAVGRPKPQADTTEPRPEPHVNAGRQATATAVGRLEPHADAALDRAGPCTKPEHRPTGGTVGGPRLREELRTVAMPRLWIAYVIAAMSSGSTVATFTYLGALLVGATGLAAAWVPAVLVLFGIGSIIGIAVGGRVADAHPHATLHIGFGGVFAAALLLALGATDPVATLVGIFALAVFGFATNPAVNVLVFSLAGNAPTLAGATNITAFNIGITLAPWTAGLLIGADLGLPSVTWVSAALAALGMGTAAWSQLLRNRHASMTTTPRPVPAET